MATPSHESTLKQLLRGAGYHYQTVDRRRIEIAFSGPYRPWVLCASLTEHWLSVWVYVCAVPELPGCRAALNELLLELNEENALVKYSCHKGDVFLQLQYRAPRRIDSESVAPKSISVYRRGRWPAHARAVMAYVARTC